MNQTIQALFWLSVLANALCLWLGVWFILKCGGLAYLLLKMPLLKKLGINGMQGNQAVSFNFPYYDHRKSQLALLPILASDIVFLGDSLTDEGEWAELLNHPAIKNRGISSETTIGILDRLHTITASQPHKIFLMIGVNDLANLQRSSVEIMQTYREILTQIRERSPQTIVFVQSCLPINPNLFSGHVSNSTIRELNSQIKSLATEFSYFYVDLHSHFLDAHDQLDTKYTSDGVHLNGIAYRHWQTLIESHVLL